MTSCKRNFRGSVVFRWLSQGFDVVIRSAHSSKDSALPSVLTAPFFVPRVKTRRQQEALASCPDVETTIRGLVPLRQLSVSEGGIYGQQQACPHVALSRAPLTDQSEPVIIKDHEASTKRGCQPPQGIRLSRRGNNWFKIGSSWKEGYLCGVLLEAEFELLRKCQQKDEEMRHRWKMANAGALLGQ